MNYNFMQQAMRKPVLKRCYIILFLVYANSLLMLQKEILKIFLIYVFNYILIHFYIEK